MTGTPRTKVQAICLLGYILFLCGCAASPPAQASTTSTEQEVRELLVELKNARPEELKGIFQRATKYANEGNQSAMEMTASMLLNGEGTVADDALAIAWTRKAYSGRRPYSLCTSISMNAYKLAEGAAITIENKQRSRLWMNEAVSDGFKLAACKKFETQLLDLYNDVVKSRAPAK